MLVSECDLSSIAPSVRYHAEECIVAVSVMPVGIDLLILICRGVDGVTHYSGHFWEISCLPVDPRNLRRLEMA